MGRITTSRRMTSIRLRDGRLYHSSRPGHVAVEEPLEVRLDGREVLSTLRTPGHDLELVHGYLLAQGLIESAADLVEARYCAGTAPSAEDGHAENSYNVIDVALATPSLAAPMPIALDRSLKGAACGVPDADLMQEVMTRSPVRSTDDVRVSPADIWAFVRDVEARRVENRRSGGLEAAALLGADGLIVREDVGALGALDAVIGAALLAGHLPLRGQILVTSSRATFDLAARAAIAGASVLVAGGPATSLAIELAERTSMTLCAAVEEGAGTMTVCAGVDRVDLSGSES